jgi:outer membrane beta-barrel protein
MKEVLSTCLLIICMFYTYNTYAFSLVQKRLYNIKHELHSMASFSPLNPYSTGYGIDVGYTWHFQSMWAYEIMRLSYDFNIPSILYKKIDDTYRYNLQATPPYEALSWKISSHIFWKPLYGKNTLLNNYFIRTEWYFLTGLGVGGITQESPLLFPRPHSKDALVYGLDTGVGFRWWISDSLSLRTELVSYVYQYHQSIEHILSLKVGTSFTWVDL